jgi:hypothetical protein
MTKTSELIEQIVRAAHRNDFRCVARNQLKGSDGKWYTFGMPQGVHYTGEKSAPYFVSESIREGTTHGKRFESSEAWEANQKRVQEAQDAEFRKCLQDMDEEQIQAQIAYWLPNLKPLTQGIA